jgi:nitrate/nitrite transport system permease protein
LRMWAPWFGMGCKAQTTAIAQLWRGFATPQTAQNRADRAARDLFSVALTPPRLQEPTMVSAVFHSPLEAAAEASAEPNATTRATNAAPRPPREPIDWREWWMRVLPPVAGMALLIGLWALLTIKSTSFPNPAQTFDAAVVLFADPFYSKGPNDQGIGWNILFSLQRVAVGFGLAALVGIPLGFIIGRFEFFNRMFSPLISLLKPVSPLAWLPIGLLVFKSANPAAIWTIFICSIWPMVVNTAVGVQRVPQDYLNVARVLNLSEWKVITRILFPAVLPYMLTGVRLSVGTA